MKKRILFVLFIILMGTYQNDVKATSERGFVTELASLKGTYPPEFVKKLKDVTEIAGSDVTLSAEATGNPMPSFTCYKDGVLITSGKRYRIEENFGKISIFIKNVQLEDAGKYTIRATNSAGVAETSCELRVEEWINY